MKRKKKPLRKKCILCFIIILIIVVVGAMLFINRKSSSIMAKFSWPQMCYNESCLYVQIASTAYQREQWLMYRRNLDENKWLLLDFQQPGIYGVGMRNVLIALDIIWLDENYTIVYIKNMAQPCMEDPCPVFASPIRAKYILEINWWLAERIWLKEWKTLTFKN